MNEKIYTQVAENYRRFMDWREKIFAGFVTSIAALGVGFAQVASQGFRIGLLCAAILVSVVFWILDFRNRALLGVCQRIGAAIEGDENGSFSGLTNLRDTWTLLTHGFATNLLVAGVIGGAIGALILYVPPWFSRSQHAAALVTAVVLFLLIMSIFEWYGWRTRREEKKAVERS